MSKSVAELAQMLSATNEQLFDRYINIKLMQKPYQVTRAGVYKKEDGSIVVDTDDFIIRTPRTGLKPHIAVTGALHTDKTVHNITVTIFNISEQIDTMAYNWAEVEVGYYNSGIHVTFIGQIISCYMAKPNPNGELVVTIASANMVDLYARGDIEVTYQNPVVDIKELVNTAFKAAYTKFPSLEMYFTGPDLMQTIPLTWQEQKFKVGRATRHYRSGLELIAWLNSLFASYTYSTRYATGAGGAPIVTETASGPVNKTVTLPPLTLSFDNQGFIRFNSVSQSVNPAVIKALNVIGNAFLSGGEATLTAPFNPGILPGDIIYVDVKYFKTRVSMEGAPRQLLSSLGNMWWVIDVNFTFDTHSANTMTLRLNNTNSPLSAQEG